MTTATLTLSDFLLARIAEDEEVARTAGHHCVEDVSDPDDVIHGPLCPGRLAAECSAKRRIVEECTSPSTERVKVRQGVYENQPVRIVRTDDLDIADGVLRILALPYTSHPDYDQEWRPS